MTIEPVDPILIETVERLFGQVATFDAVESAEVEGWDDAAWKVVAESGFPWISVPESAGGSGGTLADAMAVLRGVGRHAVPLPIAETGVLGGWLSAAAGFDVPEGPSSVVAAIDALAVVDGRLVGEAVVAWGARAERILALADDRIVSLRPADVQVERRADLAGEPRDLVRVDVSFDQVDHASAPADITATALERRGALARVNQAAGALRALAEMTIDYTHEREQFGRRIAGFQAVQIHLVTVAQAAVRAEMAADVATRAAVAGDADLEVAAARVVVDRAIDEGTRAAHQAHGAMGVTREYPLHHLSRRLWAWKHDFGTAREWRRRAGHHAVDAGADGLFPLIAR